MAIETVPPASAVPVSGYRERPKYEFASEPGQRRKITLNGEP